MKNTKSQIPIQYILRYQIEPYIEDVDQEAGHQAAKREVALPRAGPPQTPENQ